jgi:hypothetical protein
MKDKTKPLTIVRLTASNVMRLQAGLEIVPNGNTVVVAGKNKEGKSSVLNCILFALGGKAALPEKPVRSGALKGDIHLDMGEIVVDWKCSTAGSVSLIVRDRETGEVKSPQNALNALWNQMCDPVKFIRLSETANGRREQAEILRSIVGLDFGALDTERAKVYEDREAKGREIKRLKGLASSLVFHAQTPDTEISIPDVVNKLSEGRDHNATIDRKKVEIENTLLSIRESEVDIANLNASIKDLEKQIAAKKKIISDEEKEMENKRACLRTANKELSEMKPIDLSALEKQISDADDINRRVRDNQRKRNADNDVAQAEERYAVFTRQIEEIDEEKRTKLEKAKFPIEGLSFEENGILLGGLPFSQGSQAEQLMAATAIALALKPRIRVVLLRDASLMDSDTRKAVAELAAREEAQVWEEVVESDDPSAIVIEDGRVKKGEK